MTLPETKDPPPRRNGVLIVGIVVLGLVGLIALAKPQWPYQEIRQEPVPAESQKISFPSGGVSVALSLDGKHLIAVGWKGQIFTSDDEGVSWQIRNSGTSLNFVATALSADGQHAVAVGWKGAIFTSDDGGASWTSRNDKQEKPGWTAVAMSPDGRHIMVSGKTSAILTSDDGGASWKAQNSGVNFEGVDSIALTPDGVHAIIVGSTFVKSLNGVIITSDDGGSHWQSRNTGAPNTQWATAALSSDGKHAIIVGAAGETQSTERGAIFTSDNGGVSWKNRNIGTKLHLVQAVALSPDGEHAIAWGETDLETANGAIITSNDGGASWKNPNTAITPNFATEIVLSEDGKRAIALGRSSEVLVSADGQSWELPRKRQ